MKKVLSGVVVSDRMDKTVVVEVNRRKQHYLYRKQFTVTKKYLAHDPSNYIKVGQKVKITESKPFSKRKKWIVIEDNK